jgi:glucose-1-phosphate thymidylyltransferase
MRIIIPMAGKGKRMRPHTLTVPKPLIPVAGKPIVQWLVEDIIRVCREKVTEIAFVIGDFGKETEEQLLAIARAEGAQGSIYYQDEALGTAHAILCAADALRGKVIVAFADTLFRTDFTIDEEQDGVIWVSHIEDPRAFGVVKVDSQNVITDFVEKPQQFVSDLAIIGIYYFRDGETLRDEMQYLIDHDIRDKGEYQLTSALENMKRKGARFVPGTVDEWLDCGNKDATVFTNRRMLELHRSDMKIPSTAVIEESLVIPPCFIGEHVRLKHSIVGPYASVGAHTVVEQSVVTDSIVQNNSVLRHVVIGHSMIGNHAEYIQQPADVSLGDYSTHN